MEDKEKFKQKIRGAYRFLILISALIVIISIIAIYVLADSERSIFESSKSDNELVEVPQEGDDDFDKIENGVHVRTGLVDAEGLMTVVNNCTNCHSAKLVTQNRMNRERWEATIRWMQETQNLWDLGENEDIIINYLVTNYPPTEKGRRAGLGPVEWYELKE